VAAFVVLFLPVAIVMAFAWYLLVAAWFASRVFRRLKISTRFAEIPGAAARWLIARSKVEP
jgi:Na+-transporting methylmalonyl-CoA/oxaloacetate decarboxylase gamma subunit